jgi:hypothetical protein
MTKKGGRISAQARSDATGSRRGPCSALARVLQCGHPYARAAGAAGLSSGAGNSNHGGHCSASRRGLERCWPAGAGAGVVRPQAALGGPAEGAVGLSLDSGRGGRAPRRWWQTSQGRAISHTWPKEAASTAGLDSGRGSRAPIGAHDCAPPALASARYSRGGRAPSAHAPATRWRGSVQPPVRWARRAPARALPGSRAGASAVGDDVDAGQPLLGHGRRPRPPSRALLHPPRSERSLGLALSAPELPDARLESRRRRPYSLAAAAGNGAARVSYTLTAPRF